MHKQTYVALGALALIAAAGLGYVWYERSAAVPDAKPPHYDGRSPQGDVVKQPPAPIPVLTEEEWPYDRPAEHLYIQKGITLDPAVVSINNELKDVTLCGATYKTKQVMIDGVDVVQRVATLLSEASAKESKEICLSLKYAPVDFVAFGGYIGEGAELQIVVHKSAPSNPDYLVSISIARSLYSAGRSWILGLETWVGVSKNRIQFGSPTFGPKITAPLHAE